MKAEGKVPEVREELRTWRRKVTMEGQMEEERRGDWIKGTGGGVMREDEVRDLCLGQGKERV